MESGAAAGASLHRLTFEHDFERVDLVPAAELEKALIRRSTLGHIGLEHPLDDLRRVLGAHIAIDFAAERSIGPEPAANVDMITFDGVAFLRRLDLAGEQPDFADVMLRTGVRAAGEMDVDRSIELDATFAPAGDLLRMPLGIGSGKLA